MHFSVKALKYFLLLFNVICAILGFVLLWYGVWLLNSIDADDGDAVNQVEHLAAVLIIVLSVVIVLVALFGCVSEYMSSRSMLTAFAIILVLLLIIQLVLVSISHSAAHEGVSAGLKQGFDELWERSDNVNSSLAFYEEWLHCCGKNSAKDYILLDKFPPPSCCKNSDCTNVLNLYVDGCERKYKDYIHSKTCDFNIISWLLIIAEFLSSVFACILIDGLRTQRDRIRIYS